MKNQEKLMYTAKSNKSDKSPKSSKSQDISQYSKNLNVESLSLPNVRKFYEKAVKLSRFLAQGDEEAMQYVLFVDDAVKDTEKKIKAEYAQLTNKSDKVVNMQTPVINNVKEVLKDAVDQLTARFGISESEVRLDASELAKGSSKTIPMAQIKLEIEKLRDKPEELKKWVSETAPEAFGITGIKEIASALGVKAKILKDLSVKSDKKISEMSAFEKEKNEKDKAQAIRNIRNLILATAVTSLAPAKEAVRNDLIKYDVKLSTYNDGVTNYTRLLSLPTSVLKSFADLLLGGKSKAGTITLDIAKALGGRVDTIKKNDKEQQLDKEAYKNLLNNVWLLHAADFKDGASVIRFVNDNFSANDLEVMGKATLNNIVSKIGIWNDQKDLVAQLKRSGITKSEMIQLITRKKSAASETKGRRSGISRSIDLCLESDDMDVYSVAKTKKIPFTAEDSKYDICLAIAETTYNQIVASLANRLTDTSIKELRGINDVNVRIASLRDAAASAGVPVDEVAGIATVEDLVAAYAKYYVKSKVMAVDRRLEADVDALFNPNLLLDAKREIIAENPAVWYRALAAWSDAAVNTVESALAVIDTIQNKQLQGRKTRSPSTIRQASYKGAPASQVRDFSLKSREAIMKSPSLKKKLVSPKTKSSPVDFKNLALPKFNLRRSPVVETSDSLVAPPRSVQQSIQQRLQRSKSPSGGLSGDAIRRAAVDAASSFDTE